MGCGSRGRKTRLNGDRPTSTTADVPDSRAHSELGFICFGAREAELVANAQFGGATPLWESIGDDGATVFTQ
jgi:hypothetical protein